MDDVAAAVERGGAWADELTDLARAVAGGCLLGVPLIFTMEVWWAGARSQPGRNLVVLLAALAIVIVLQRTSGFRRTRDATWADAAVDGAKVVALSALAVTALLIVLRQITADTAVPVAVGKVVHQTFAFSIGASVARQFLSESRDEGDEGDGGDGGDRDVERLHPTVADVGATVIGAIFVGLSIAPTDEVPMLATALDPAWLIALVATSLALSYSIVFVAGFSGQHQRHAQQGVFQHPITETVMCYLVSLVCAGLMVRIFRPVDGDLSHQLASVIVLGLPTTIGGAAGRLAI